MPFANSSSRSRCGSWNPRAVGQRSKAHMVMEILATQRFSFPAPTLILTVCDAAVVLLPEVGTYR